MRSRACFVGLGLLWGALMVAGCENGSNRNHHSTTFSKADSLTEVYLAMQDTMLQVWNTMIFDDNRKIRTMRNLLHELRVSNPDRTDELDNFEDRLNDLFGMRYDQQSMSDPAIVSEYDFASNSLVAELVALTESEPEYSYNTTLQRMVESIESADQRVMNYRAEYDDIALRFNRFIDRHHSMLDDIYTDSLPRKKPLFQMAAD